MPALAHPSSRGRLAQLCRHTAACPIVSPTNGRQIYLGVGGGTDGDALEIQRIYNLIEEKMSEYHTTGVAFGICRGAESALRAFGSAQSLPLFIRVHP